MTDETNLSSIAEQGLLSKSELIRRRIEPAFIGGSGLTLELDHQYGLFEYVFLGFNSESIMPKHTSTWPRRRPRLLGIAPEVLYFHGAKIALGRANHARTKVYGVRQAALRMDHTVFTGAYDASDLSMKPRAVRVFNYEVLIPCCVPPEYIKLLD